MRPLNVVALASVLLSASGCAGLPFTGGASAEERKAPCDRLAAQAIQTEDVGEARRLAAAAADCYGGLQGE